MNGLYYGICLLFVIGCAMADCNMQKMMECQSQYAPKMQDGGDKETMCKVASDLMNCMESAASGCGDEVEKIFDQVRSQIAELGCPQSSHVPKLYAHSSVISGAFIAAVAFKKLLL
ncbi:uncharacterized protein LOC115218432 isoform X1 [Octopus sinensis]|uniref:Uncharacterized protein LOC115218432 isoform X1 n=1 Tax=Octopus sinensis TaxID=2607531 RepID=A0A6P7T165_9MOLL|nr:uncharacterized protein LOC115218432 isoform X1 [Octopus sinensis]